MAKKDKKPKKAEKKAAKKAEKKARKGAKRTAAAKPEPVKSADTTSEPETTAAVPAASPTAKRPRSKKA